MPVSLHRELAETAKYQRVSINQLACVALAGSLGRMNSGPIPDDVGDPHGLSKVGPGFESIMRSMGFDETDD
jgi:hypothetical protein